MGRIGAWFGGSTTGMKALVALACVVVLLASGCYRGSSLALHPARKRRRRRTKDPRKLEAETTREGTSEAAKPATKKATGHGTANPKPNPKPAKPPTNTVRPARDATVTVSGVIDGDAIEVSPAVNGRKDVRLIGVNTPETVDADRLLPLPRPLEVRPGRTAGLKLALVLLWERRAECPGAVPMACVHGEIVVECEEAGAENVKARLEKAMIDRMNEVLNGSNVGGPRVPVEVETQIGKSWAW